MIKCNLCETSFEVIFDHEEDKLAYCPACGEELIDDLDDNLSGFEYWDEE